MAIVSFALVAVGIFLILLGSWMSYKDWERKCGDSIQNRKDALADSLSALAKLMEAIKGYPAGQQMIVLGIVILIVAGLFGGIAQL